MDMYRVSNDNENGDVSIPGFNDYISSKLVDVCMYVCVCVLHVCVWFLSIYNVPTYRPVNIC